MPELFAGLTLFQLLGVILLLLVIVRTSLSLASAVQRMNLAKGIDSIQREELQRRIEREKLQITDRKEQLELGWSGYRKFVIERVVRWENESSDIASFYFVPHDRRPLPRFKPGQFLTIRVNAPGHDKPLVRCYSLSDCHDGERYRLSIKRVPDGKVSGYMHELANENDLIDVRAPSGAFFLDINEDHPTVLIGGGVGVTPMVSMFSTIAREQPNRRVLFFYAARTQAEFMEKARIEALANNCPNAHVVFIVSQAGDEDRELIGDNVPQPAATVQHLEGRVNAALIQSLLHEEAELDTHFYICGPPPMMAAMDKDLREWGAQEAQIHMEAFGPASVPKKKPAASEDKPARTAQVQFKKASKTVNWSGDADNLLDFAEEQGIEIPSACRAGNCGSCMTAILSGEVEYVKEAGSPPDAGMCLPCICIPKDALVLDA